MEGLFGIYTLRNIMGDYRDVFMTKPPKAGKPSGKGNNTQPLIHFKPKKKEFGTKKLSRKQRKMK